MSKARFQASDMLTRIQAYESAEAAAKGAAQEEAKRLRDAVKKAAQKRIKAHQHIIDHSMYGVKQIEDKISQLEATLSMMTHERYARFADSQVNDKRREIRSKRPQAEQFQDQLSIYLSREMNVLGTSRKELLEREKQVKAYIAELELARIELSHDTGTRRLQIEHEYVNLKPVFGAPTHKAEAEEGVVTDKSPSAPESPSAGASRTSVKTPVAAAAPAPAPAEEEAPPPHSGSVDAMAIIKKTFSKLDEIDQFCDKSKDAVFRSRRAGTEATASVTKGLSKRTIELCAVKKTIEQHILDVDYAIVKAEANVDKQEKRLNPKDLAKKATLDQTKQLLESMNKTKAAMTVDLRAKIAALDLDNSCRRVTAQVAAEKKPGTSEKKKRPQNSSSLPNLHSTGSISNSGGAEILPSPSGFRGSDASLSGTLRPGSPPGASKSLKAGGMASVAAG